MSSQEFGHYNHTQQQQQQQHYQHTFTKRIRRLGSAKGGEASSGWVMFSGVAEPRARESVFYNHSTVLTIIIYLHTLAVDRGSTTRRQKVSDNFYEKKVKLDGISLLFTVLYYDYLRLVSSCQLPFIQERLIVEGPAWGDQCLQYA